MTSVILAPFGSDPIDDPIDGSDPIDKDVATAG